MGDEAKRVQIPYTITVRDLAKLLQSNSIQVMRILMANGVMANINQLVDFDTAAIVASEMGFEAVPESKDPSSGIRFKGGLSCLQSNSF